MKQLGRKKIYLLATGVGCFLIICLLVGLSLALVAPAQVRRFQANRLRAQGFVLHQQGDFRGALANFEEALLLYEANEDQTGKALVLNDIGLSYYFLGNYDTALDYHQQALTLSEGAGDQVGRGRTLNNMGTVYDTWGQYQLGLEYHRQALAIQQETGDQAGEAATLTSLGAVYFDLGQYAQGLAHLEQALAIQQTVGDRLSENVTRQNLGQGYFLQGRYERALAEFQQVRAFAEVLGNKVAEGTALNSIGQVYQALGQPEQALAQYEPALNLLRQAGNPRNEAAALNGLGLVYTTLGQPDQALAHYRQALELMRATGDRPGEAVALNNLALVYNGQGQPDQALDYQQQALELLEEVGDQTRIALALANIGTTYALMQEYDRGLEYYQQALALQQEIGHQAGQIMTLVSLGGIYEDLEETDRAIDFYQQAVEIIETLQTGFRVEELQRDFAARQAPLYERLVTLLWQTGQFEAAFNYAERARARALLDQLAGGSIDFRVGAKPWLIEQERELRTRLSLLRAQLIQLHSRPLAERDQALIAATQADLAGAEAGYASLLIELKLQSPELASLLSAEVITLAELQELIAADTTLLIYFVTGEVTLAFIITRASFDVIRLEPTRQDLSEAITAFRDFATLDESHPASLQKLHRWLIEPLKPFLKTRAVGVIPHSHLHYLPFAALTDGQRYVSDDFVIFNLPSASALQFIAAKSKSPPQTALVLGNPTIADPLPTLPYAQREAEAVANLYEGQAWVGTEATEDIIWSQAPTADIVHLAVHSTFNPYNPIFSTLHLAATEEHDGRLEVHEIYHLDLTGPTELVVLSACETQVGNVNAGDEVASLNRVFLYAGAPSVIASLWAVEDEATSRLMERFYTHLKEELGKAEALRQAQLELREAYPNPYYWSGFVLSGDPGQGQTP